LKYLIKQTKSALQGSFTHYMRNVSAFLLSVQ